MRNQEKKDNKKINKSKLEKEIKRRIYTHILRQRNNSPNKKDGVKLKDL